MTRATAGVRFPLAVFLVVALFATVLLAGIGYYPTRLRAGGEGVEAMLAGLAIGLISSIAGVIPMVLPLGSGVGVAHRFLLSISVRFAVVLVLALAATFSGWFVLGPLLVWVGIGYLGLKGVEAMFAIRLNKQAKDAVA